MPRETCEQDPNGHHIHSEGILRGIPTYDKSVNGLTAIVTGANGISGHAMVTWLARHPERWATIHAISRRPAKKKIASNVVQHSVDLLNSSPEELSNVVKEKGINGDYLFHFAYTDQSATSASATASLWSSTDGLIKNNSHMLDAIISGLKMSGNPVKHVMLQTGGKHYGHHLGPALDPAIEDDPEVEYEGNFYYALERILQKHQEEEEISWTVARPSFIVGAPQEINSLNAAMIYAFYCAINKELGVEEVEFPGNISSWNGFCDQSYDLLNACFEEYIAVTPKCHNQAFNIHDGDIFTWSRGWPRIAEYYGLNTGPVRGEGPYPYKSQTRTPGPRDGNYNTIQLRVCISEWAKQPHVKEAAKRLIGRHGLQPDLYEKTWWPLADFLFGVSWNIMLSTTKARDYGFFGYCDSMDAHYEAFKRAEKAGLLPPPGRN